ncbi:MAG: amidohydrolase family protein [Planctomycetes bacterium]|nr:amidohydrolase family protein [Planctomycetota bacterium]
MHPQATHWATHRALCWTVLAAAFGGPVSASTDGGKTSASPAGSVTLIKAAKVILRPGKIEEHTSVLVQDGKIIAIGANLTAPEGAREIEGEVVCAGFIDAWSSFGVDADALRDERVSAASLTTDAWDPYVDERFRLDVLRGGVTSMRVGLAPNAKVGGVGAVVRLHPRISDRRAIVLADACIALGVGITRSSRGLDPFDRLADVDRALGAVGDGWSYLQDKVEYKHELEAWQKTVADKEKELEDGAKKAKKDREKEKGDAEKAGKEFKEKAYKEDKRPKPPRFDDDKEVLARAANGELPVVVEVHRAVELRSFLDGAARYDRTRWILAGASESLPFAKQLADHGITVLVSPTPMGQMRTEEMRDADPSLAGRLSEAGVKVLIGSGMERPLGSRDLALVAQIAIGNGLPREKAFEALTLGAARAFDVADRIGSVEVGKDADLLVLDGEPLLAATRVRYVLSAGDLVITPEN